jgi:hypothetical protein
MDVKQRIISAELLTRWRDRNAAHHAVSAGIVTQRRACCRPSPRQVSKTIRPDFGGPLL